MEIILLALTVIPKFQTDILAFNSYLYCNWHKICLAISAFSEEMYFNFMCCLMDSTKLFQYFILM